MQADIGTTHKEGHTTVRSTLRLGTAPKRPETRPLAHPLTVDRQPPAWAIASFLIYCSCSSWASPHPYTISRRRLTRGLDLLLLSLPPSAQSAIQSQRSTVCCGLSRHQAVQHTQQLAEDVGLLRTTSRGHRTHALRRAVRTGKGTDSLLFLTRTSPLNPLLLLAAGTRRTRVYFTRMRRLYSHRPDR